MSSMWRKTYLAALTACLVSSLNAPETVVAAGRKGGAVIITLLVIGCFCWGFLAGVYFEKWTNNLDD